MSASPGTSVPARPVRERAFWLLTAGVAAVFAWPIALGRTYFFRDLYFWIFPQRARLPDLVRSGALPLWDGLVYGGQPLLGNIQYLLLYPTALLSLLMSPILATNVEIALHFALSAAAAYALARILGMTPPASALAGIVFAICGITLSFGNLFGRLLAMPHTALLLLFWHLFLRDRRRLWFVLAAAAGALPILAGSAEQLAFALPLVAAWGFVFPYDSPRSGSPGRRLALSLPLAAAIAGISAVALLPMAELVRHSGRGAGLPAAERGNWSVDPRRLPELAVPGFFGETATLRESDYWGAAVEDMRFPVLLSFYFGATVLTLALGSGLSRRAGPLARGVRRLLAAVLFGSIVLSLGRHLPTGGLFDPTRLLGPFRYPSKFLFAAPLPAALLAGTMADGLWRDEDSPARIPWLPAAALAAAALALAGAALAIAHDAEFLKSFSRTFFRQEATPFLRDNLGARLRQAALNGGAGALLLFTGSRVRRLAPWLLCGIVAVDLGSAGAGLNPTAPRALLTSVPSLAVSVRRQIGDGRFFRDPNPPGIALRAPSNEIRWRYEWNRETLANYSASSFGIPSIFQESFDELDLDRHARIQKALRRIPWERRLPILSAASVRLFVSADDVRAAGVESLGEVPNASDRTFRLYRNLRAAGRAELVHYWRLVGSPDEAIRAMASPGFDPRRHAVVEGVANAPPDGPCAPPAVENVAFRENGQTWKTRADCAGLLVLSEPDAPGWKALLDGIPAPIVPTNGMFSGVLLPAGAHMVTRSYEPVSLAVGALLSLLSLAILLAWSARSSHKSQKTAAHQGPDQPGR